MVVEGAALKDNEEWQQALLCADRELHTSFPLNP